ncbi:MAG: type II toxin-antitoxin system RelE/ParE family toxin [Coriobacteriales bacterium]|jgi:mRNA interferase RelE/StbE|nr:type II toxin-antitoxin system RelE/ParE family toxin [Coriobacteriales bacterium]
MAYRLVPTAQFEKDLKRIGPSNARLVVGWIARNLEGCEDPKARGQQLRYDLKQYWRYRIGDMRLLVDIQEDSFVLVLVTVGHRSTIYRDQKR